MRRISIPLAMCGLTLLLAAPGAPASAGGATQFARSHLEFTVVRNDEAVGTHVIDFMGEHPILTAVLSFILANSVIAILRGP